MQAHEFFASMDHECSKFLSVTTQPVYRGLRDANKDLLRKSIRTDRRPTSGEATRDGPFRNFVYNQIVQFGYDIGSLRLRAAFVTGDVREAVRYGEPYVVFPTNDTRIFVTEGSDSLSLNTETVREFYRLYMNELEHFTADGKRDFSSGVVGFFRNGDRSVFQSHIDWEKRSARIQLLGTDGNDAMEDSLYDLYESPVWERTAPREIDMRDMNHAAKTGLEMMFYGADYYYAIARDKMLTELGGDYSDDETEAYANLLGVVEEGV